MTVAAFALKETIDMQAHTAPNRRDLFNDDSPVNPLLVFASLICLI